MDEKNIHPAMVRFWSAKTGLTSPHDIFRYIENLLCPFLEQGELLGTGGEGFVYRDGSIVKKFILNWDDTSRNLKVTYRRLRDMGQHVSEAKHLYCISVQKLGEEILLVSYPYENSIPLKHGYLRRHWHTSLKHQYKRFQHELIQTGYFIRNVKCENFRLVHGTIKFIDYGSDCIPLSEALHEIGRMFFMRINKIYDLGP